MTKKNGYAVIFNEYQDGQPYFTGVVAASANINLADRYMHEKAQDMIDGGHRLVERRFDAVRVMGQGGYECEWEVVRVHILS